MIMLPDAHVRLLQWIRDTFNTVGISAPSEDAAANTIFFVSILFAFGIGAGFALSIPGGIWWELLILIPAASLAWCWTNNTYQGDAAFLGLAYPGVLIGVAGSSRARPPNQIWIQGIWIGVTMFLGALYLYRAWFIAFFE